MHRFQEGVAEHQSQHSKSCSPEELAALQQHALRRAATDFMTAIVPTTGAEGSMWSPQEKKKKTDKKAEGAGTPAPADHCSDGASGDGAGGGGGGAPPTRDLADLNSNRTLLYKSQVKDLGKLKDLFFKAVESLEEANDFRAKYTEDLAAQSPEQRHITNSFLDGMEFRGRCVKS